MNDSDSESDLVTIILLAGAYLLYLKFKNQLRFGTLGTTADVNKGGSSDNTTEITSVDQVIELAPTESNPSPPVSIPTVTPEIPPVIEPTNIIESVTAVASQFIPDTANIVYNKRLHIIIRGWPPFINLVSTDYANPEDSGTAGEEFGFYVQRSGDTGFEFANNFVGALLSANQYPVYLNSKWIGSTSSLRIPLDQMPYFHLDIIHQMFLGIKTYMATHNFYA